MIVPTAMLVYSLAAWAVAEPPANNEASLLDESAPESM